LIFAFERRWRVACSPLGMELRSVTAIAYVCAAAMFAAACTGNNSHLIPTAASAVESNLASTPTADRGNLAFATTAQAQIDGSGPVSAVAGTCPALTMTVYGVSVEVNSSTAYSASTSCEQLKPGVVVRVQGEMTTTEGGETHVLVRHLTIQRGPHQPVEGEGVLSDMSGDCPARQLTVRGVRVTLSAETVYRWRSNRTATCEDLALGMLLHVSADITPEGEVIANRVLIQNEVAGPPGNRTPRGPQTPPPGNGTPHDATPSGPR
jgi:hypothetical protein